jgi:hypothetical protein
MHVKALGAMSFKVWVQSSLLAGMNWNNGTNCGSQSQNANNYRWNTNSNISAQFLADPRTIPIQTPTEAKLAKLTPWLQLNSLLISKWNEQNTKQEMEVG